MRLKGPSCAISIPFGARKQSQKSGHVVVYIDHKNTLEEIKKEIILLIKKNHWTHKNGQSMVEGYLVHQLSPKATSNATIVTINISDNTSINTAIKISVTIKAPKYISCLSS